MSIFCTNCGKELRPEAKFCTQCGAEVLNNEELGVNDEPKFDDVVYANAETEKLSEGLGEDVVKENSSFNTQNNFSSEETKVFPKVKNTEDIQTDLNQFDEPKVNWEQTASMPAVAPRQELPYTTSHEFSENSLSNEGKKKSSVVTTILIIVVAIIAILGGVLLAFLHPWNGFSDNSSTDKPVAVELDKKDSESSTDKEAESDKDAEKDKEEESDKSEKLAQEQKKKDFKILSSSYSQMGTIDGEIANQAVFFNNNFVKNDMNARKSGLSRCEEIRSEIENLQEELEAVSSDEYSDTTSELEELADALYHRIDVICQSWDNSIAYGTSAKHHSDEICAPLSVDSNSDGKNEYKIYFDKNYPSAKPVEVN